MTKIDHGFIIVDKLNPWAEYGCVTCCAIGEIPDDLISCEGATLSVTIITSIIDPAISDNYNSDIEVFVNGVSRGIWPCSQNLYETLWENINLPEFTIVDAPNLEGLQTTITNASNEYVRLEFRAINAPTRHGGYVDVGENQNPSAIFELQGGNISLPHPEEYEPWDILKVCLAPLVTSGISCADATSYVILSPIISPA